MCKNPVQRLNDYLDVILVDFLEEEDKKITSGGVMFVSRLIRNIRKEDSVPINFRESDFFPMTV